MRMIGLRTFTLSELEKAPITIPTQSAELRRWLGGAYYKQHKKPLNSKLKDEFVDILCAKGIYDGQCHDVHVRSARFEDKYIIDLSDKAGRVVVVDASGWKVEPISPVRFVRPATALALPVPQRGGDLNKLWEFANIPKVDRKFLIAWMLDCWRPDSEFPLLELGGEQGSSKSTTQDFIKSLIDPQSDSLRVPISSVNDLYLYGTHALVLSLNNLSNLTPEFQDALCSVSTGGAFSKRTLYKDDEQTVIQLKRPIVMNGISILATAPDLVDRTIRIELPRLKSRMVSEELTRRFEEVKPLILGALLDCFVTALKILPQISKESTSEIRMVSFARLGSALCWEQGPDVFTTAYLTKRKDQSLSTLEGSPVAMAVIALLSQTPDKPEFIGTVGELLRKVLKYRNGDRSWPMSARGFGDVLRRTGPALRTQGVHLEELRRSSAGRRLRIFVDPKVFVPINNSEVEDVF